MATTCVNASVGGNLECLKYLHENGCPWDEHSCRTASMSGHLECLKYLHETNGLGKKNVVICHIT